MIRTSRDGYENKRSKSLLKYKDFCDEEFRVVAIIEDKRGGGIVGAFELELSEPCKDRSGNEIKTFRAGIKNLSREEGKELLVEGQLPIKAVSQEAGFYDQAHLTRAFRAAFGTTPLQYRHDFARRRS